MAVGKGHSFLNRDKALLDRNRYVDIRTCLEHDDTRQNTQVLERNTYTLNMSTCTK